MTPPDVFKYTLPTEAPPSVLKEEGIESGFIGKLQGLKYEYRPDITDRASLERNFRAKFEADLVPLLTKRAGGRDISGLSAYE